jgi:hypothetical protein
MDSRDRPNIAEFPWYDSHDRIATTTGHPIKEIYEMTVSTGRPWQGSQDVALAVEEPGQDSYGKTEPQ